MSSLLLRDFPLPPLSDAADEALRRAWALLVGVHQAAHHTAVISRGYSRAIHEQGAGLVAWVSGEQSFALWRQWRVLRPPRDPELPAEVAQLAAFVERWQPIAIASVYQLDLADDDREELLSYVSIDRDHPSKTWQAKSYGQILRHLAEVPADFYQALARMLAARGVTGELSAMEATLARVQRHLRNLPVDEDERRDIQAWREQSATQLHAWLDERRTQLASLGPEQLTLLGLGELLPPPARTDLLATVAQFSMGAQA